MEKGHSERDPWLESPGELLPPKDPPNLSYPSNVTPQISVHITKKPNTHKEVQDAFLSLKDTLENSPRSTKFFNYDRKCLIIKEHVWRANITQIILPRLGLTASHRKNYKIQHCLGGFKAGKEWMNFYLVHPLRGKGENSGFKMPQNHVVRCQKKIGSQVPGPLCKWERTQGRGTQGILLCKANTHCRAHRIDASKWEKQMPDRKSLIVAQAYPLKTVAQGTRKLKLKK